MTQPVILAVDDEPANLKLLQRILSGEDYHMVGVPDGESALTFIAGTQPDLILLDIMMPGMNGLDVLRHLRADAATAHLPVILISALADARNITAGLELGANDYITKPIDVDVTLARVRTQVRLKQFEDQQKAMITQLEEAQEMKDRFLRMVSHDLKGPLTNVRMIGSLLRKSEAEIINGTTLLDILDSSTDTMQALITDFLDAAALQFGALKLNLAPVALHDIIHNQLVQHNVHAEEKHIAVNVLADTGTIYADPVRFGQALGNLISNAIKYSPPETTVRVWTEDDGGCVRVCVADAGPGIPDDERDRLFTQFGKLSARPTAGESSTGLGLWIVKHLVTIQHGHVGVYCPPEGGSLFWIEMPAA